MITDEDIEAIKVRTVELVEEGWPEKLAIAKAVQEQFPLEVTYIL